VSQLNESHGQRETLFKVRNEKKKFERKNEGILAGGERKGVSSAVAKDQEWSEGRMK